MTEHLQAFLEILSSERGVANNTLAAYKSDIQDVLAFLGERTATSSLLQTYVHALYDRGIKARTVARRLSSLKAFYQYVHENTQIPSPMEGISTPRFAQPLPKDLSLEDVRTLMHTAKTDNSPEGKRLLALLEILYATGMRISEALTLPIQGIERLQEGKHLLINGKGNKERYVFFSPPALEALSSYLVIRGHFTQGILNPFVFASSKTHLSRQRVCQLLTVLAKKAGLCGKRVTPHTLRHAFATHLLREGMDIVMVQTLLGHKDISTTQLYTHVLGKQLEEALVLHHPLSKKASLAT